MCPLPSSFSLSLAISRLPCSGLCQCWIRLNTSPTFFIMESAFLPRSLPGRCPAGYFGTYASWPRAQPCQGGYSRLKTAEDCLPVPEPKMRCCFVWSIDIAYMSLSRRVVEGKVCKRRALKSELGGVPGQQTLVVPSLWQAVLRTCRLGVGEAVLGEGLSCLHIFLPLLQPHSSPHHRFLKTGWHLCSGTCGPHTSPWVKGRSS